MVAMLLICFSGKPINFIFQLFGEKVKLDAPWFP